MKRICRKVRRFRTNRRIERSEVPETALALQLKASAARARFGTYVLASKFGSLVAGMGEEDACKELAAMAPKLAGRGGMFHGQVGLAEGHAAITVASICPEIGPYFLCAEGGRAGAIGQEFQKSAKGVARILG